MPRPPSFIWTFGSSASACWLSSLQNVPRACRHRRPARPACRHGRLPSEHRGRRAPSRRIRAIAVPPPRYRARGYALAKCFSAARTCGDRCTGRVPHGPSGPSTAGSSIMRHHVADAAEPARHPLRYAHRALRPPHRPAPDRHGRRCPHRRGRSIDAARGHGGHAIDEFGLSHRLHRIGPVGTVKRAALDIDGADYIMPAARIFQQFVEQVARRLAQDRLERVRHFGGQERQARAPVPQMMVRIDDRQIRFEYRLRSYPPSPVLPKMAFAQLALENLARILARQSVGKIDPCAAPYIPSAPFCSPACNPSASARRPASAARPPWTASPNSSSGMPNTAQSATPGSLWSSASISAG
jgi:hypothetical protein